MRAKRKAAAAGNTTKTPRGRASLNAKRKAGVVPEVVNSMGQGDYNEDITAGAPDGDEDDEAQGVDQSFSDVDNDDNQDDNDENDDNQDDNDADNDADNAGVSTTPTTTKAEAKNPNKAYYFEMKKNHRINLVDGNGDKFASVKVEDPSPRPPKSWPHDPRDYVMVTSANMNIATDWSTVNLFTKDQNQSQVPGILRKNFMKFTRVMTPKALKNCDEGGFLVYIRHVQQAEKSKKRRLK